MVKPQNVDCCPEIGEMVESHLKGKCREVQQTVQSTWKNIQCRGSVLPYVVHFGLAKAIHEDGM